MTPPSTKAPTGDSSPDLDAITRVEAELAFQGDTVHALNEALAAQQLEILTLRDQVRLLQQQVKALRREVADGTAAPAGPEAPPPHY